LRAREPLYMRNIRVASQLAHATRGRGHVALSFGHSHSLQRNTASIEAADGPATGFRCPVAVLAPIVGWPRHARTIRTRLPGNRPKRTLLLAAMRHDGPINFVYHSTRRVAPTLRDAVMRVVHGDGDLSPKLPPLKNRVLGSHARRSRCISSRSMSLAK
jgi:hypothetical protein